MNRHHLKPRENWEDIVSNQGFTYHTANDEPYWNEEVCYSFSLGEINSIEAATNKLHEMCIQAVDYVIDNNRFSDMGIGDYQRELIINSWNNPKYDEISLFGRFDLGYDGWNIKMFEYNADTPTSLPEAAVVQWFWLKDVFPNKDQFNSLHERILERWKQFPKMVYMTSVESEEDEGNLRYLADVAAQAGVQSQFININDIGWNGTNFTDLEEHKIDTFFKLYPWEWMLTDEFAKHIPQARWIEPAWKSLLSNKAIMAILWEMFPFHEYLLRTSLTEIDGNYVTKPFLSREGANISFHAEGLVHKTEGPYQGKNIYQQLFTPQTFESNYPVLGSWIIGEEAGGMGVRETPGLVTNNLSRFVPHYIE